MREGKIEVNALRRHANNHTTHDANIDLRILIDSPLLVLVASVRCVRSVALLENRRFFGGRWRQIASATLIGRYVEPVEQQDFGKGLVGLTPPDRPQQLAAPALAARAQRLLATAARRQGNWKVEWRARSVTCLSLFRMTAAEVDEGHGANPGLRLCWNEKWHLNGFEMRRVGNISSTYRQKACLDFLPVRLLPFRAWRTLSRLCWNLSQNVLRCQ